LWLRFGYQSAAELSERRWRISADEGSNPGGWDALLVRMVEVPKENARWTDPAGVHRFENELL
jgi:hypothetical protein